MTILYMRQVFLFTFVRTYVDAVVLQHIQTPPSESQRDAITASKWTTASKNFTWTRAQRDKLTSHFFKQFNMAVFSGQVSLQFLMSRNT